MLSPFLQELKKLGADSNSGAALTLDSMLSEKKLSHALIIESEDSELCYAIARLVAKAAVCRCETPMQGDCDICKIFAEGRIIPDIIDIEGSGASGAINVASIRELRGERSLSPLLADCFICILRDTELMQREAQNAFLKLFEEPPEGVKFILCCARSTKLLETIRSRGCVLRFESDSAELSSATPELCEFADKLLYSIALGTDAETMLLSSYFSYRNGKGESKQLRRSMNILCERLGLLLRDALIIGAGSPELSQSGSLAAQKLAESIPAGRLQAMLDELPEFKQAIRANAPISLLATALCVKLRQGAGK